jgi:hypothetical protein
MPEVFNILLVQFLNNQMIFNNYNFLLPYHSILS